MIAALKGLALAALLLTQQPMSAADSAELDRKTREVATELRCPVCQGESIQESPAELSQEMKAIVREQLAAGKTPDEVKAYFVGRYGEWILLRPTTSGVNALLYWLPPLLLVAGAVLVVVIARRWTRASAAAPTPPVTPDNVS
jgi:cytochrome c-type biogenesis protein CcmH